MEYMNDLNGLCSAAIRLCDCIELYDKKNVVEIINGGKVIKFDYETKEDVNI